MIIFNQKHLTGKEGRGEPHFLQKGKKKAIEKKAKNKLVERLTHKMFHKHFLDILSKKTPLTDVEICLAKITHSIIMINALVPNICSCGIWTR